MSEDHVQRFTVLRPFTYRREDGSKAWFREGQVYDLVCEETIFLSGLDVKKIVLTYLAQEPNARETRVELLDHELEHLVFYELIRLEEIGGY